MTISFDFYDFKPTLQLNLIDEFRKIVDNPRTQFFNTFLRPELLDESQQVYRKFQHKKLFVHVGIGGSSLGPEMLISSLSKSDFPFIFVNNIDPDEIASQLEQVKKIGIEHTLFYFVSKSGGTAETLAALHIITTFLCDNNVSLKDLKDYFVFATDPVKSELRQIASLHQITTLEVPSDVGGRFSVLTPVGFLPALFAQINLEQLLLGAREYQKLLLLKSADNPLLAMAEILSTLYHQQGISQTVLMPYSSKLKTFSFWFTQLWAESLGKKKNIHNEIVHLGLTPIVAYGATDQHSQMQLFMEGPNDKCLIFIEVESFHRDFKLQSALSGNNLDKLSGFSLGQLMKAELEGSIRALKDAKRPLMKIKMPRNDEFHLAQLILFFESLTALMGHNLKIDPFDQPGVEAGKIYAFEFLNQLK